MKKLLGFMFGYGARGNGPLGWNTRLSQPDHLYHQGRNFLSMVLYGLFCFVLGVILILAGVGLQLNGTGSGMGGSTTPVFIGLVIGIIIGALPMFYLSFAAIKLTILRLHDFGLSGWWILYSIILGLMDYCFDSFFPGFTFFLSMQSLVYLGLLVWPAPSAASNSYGDASINSTAAKPRWIRAVPLVLWTFSWLAGMVSPITVKYLAETQHQSAVNQAVFTEQAITTGATQHPTPNTHN